MKVSALDLPDVKLIQPDVYPDRRGFFLETWRAADYADAGIGSRGFVQDNRSRSLKGVLRGLHFQVGKPQGKLVYVTRGAVFDVAVDIRRDSPTFGKWTGCELSDENHCQLWIPPGFAHGFCVLSDVADVSYKCTETYRAEWDRGIRWDDPDIGIDWPVAAPLVSAKDRALPGLGEAVEDAAVSACKS